MKFVVTGSAGHVSKPLTELLLRKGHDVTVVGRKAEHLAGLVKLGATPAVGDMRDVSFLKGIFKGTDGVYLMVPPMWDADDQKQLSTAIARGFAEAIKDAGLDIQRSKPKVEGLSIEDFAQQFAVAYRQ
jgi:uncharacterized protein YbjT (DUF2867 family)